MIRRIDNSIANHVLDRFAENGYIYIPPNITTGQFIQYSCDNIDVLEATLDGKNTFHCTQMMAWQRCDSSDTQDEVVGDIDRNKRLDREMMENFHQIDKAKLPANGRPTPSFGDEVDFKFDQWLNQKKEVTKSKLTDISWIIARQKETGIQKNFPFGEDSMRQEAAITK